MNLRCCHFYRYLSQEPDNVISFAYGELKIAFSAEADLPSDCMQRAAALAKSQSFQKITTLVHVLTFSNLCSRSSVPHEALSWPFVYYLA